MEQYQDVWVKGAVHTPGVRACALRWELIRPLLEEYKRPFTVLDLGANLGYFSLRILENFPDATVVAVEDGYTDWLMNVVALNGYPDRLIVLKRHITTDDLTALGEVEHFDVTLALSVVHHLDGHFDDTLEALRSLGDNLVVELPVESSACGQDVVDETYIPDDANVLGYAPSHLTDEERPVLWLKTPKDQLAHAYLGSPFSLAHMRIDSTPWLKDVFFNTRSEHRPWVRGINLHTYLEMGGLYPDRGTIADQIETAYDPKARYSDIQTWNIVISGDKATLIDREDPRTLDEDDTENLTRVLAELRE